MICRLCHRAAKPDPHDALCSKHWRAWWRQALRVALPDRRDPPPKSKPYPWQMPSAVELEIDTPLEPRATRPRWRHLGLLEITQRNIGQLPVSTSELYVRVIDDYGSISRRVFYAILAVWRARGVIGFRREGQAYFYVRQPS